MSSAVAAWREFKVWLEETTFRGRLRALAVHWRLLLVTACAQVYQPKSGAFTGSPAVAVRIPQTPERAGDPSSVLRKEEIRA
jgi:hypothetical protein